MWGNSETDNCGRTRRTIIIRLRKTTTTLEWLSQYIEKQEGTIESLFFDWRIYGRTKKAGGKFL